MSSPPVKPVYYADFAALASLKRTSHGGDARSVRAVAQQFESLFTGMVLKSMREAKLGDGLGDSQETDLYTGMFDQQMALQMSQGKGLGLADMLVQQLTRAGALRGAAAASATLDSAVSAGSAAAVPASAPTATTPNATMPATTAPAASRPMAFIPTSGAASNAPDDAERAGFVARLAPYAEAAASTLGVSSDALIAQAALETGWGRSVPADAAGNSSNNLFGIKSGSAWNGPSVSASTAEYAAGTRQQRVQNFRAYDSAAQSVADYVALLQGNSRYARALGTGNATGAFAQALQQGGYATDPAYAQKLVATTASVRALRDAEASAAAAPLKILAGVPTTRGGESA